MNLVIIGVVCLALIGVACLYFGKDGAIISTIIALIAGAAGFGVNKAKQELAPGDIQIPVVKTDSETKAVSLVSYSVPVKSPMTDGGEMIDFGKVNKEIGESICSMGLEDTISQRYALAHNRAVAARVKSLDEVIQWNSYLIGLAKAAFADVFKTPCPDSQSELDVAVEDYRKRQCRWLNEGEKVVAGWVKRLFGHREALSRLQFVGLDWNKLFDVSKNGTVRRHNLTDTLVACSGTGETVN